MKPTLEQLNELSGFNRQKANAISKSCRKLIHGVGINDAWYMVRISVDGEFLSCPFYVKWKSMIERCYSEKSLKKRSSYKGCTVSSEWLIFSNFLRWIEKNQEYGDVLDKDVKISGNKYYSAESCLMIDSKLNALLTDSAASRGQCPIGVTFRKDTGKFRAKCRVEGEEINLGSFAKVSDAAKAYRKAKANEILRVSKLYPAIEGYIAQHAFLLMNQEPV